MKNKIVKSHHLIIALAIVITIITGVLLLLLNNSTEKEIVKEFNAQQLYMVKNLSREIETYLINRVQLIDVLSSIPAFQNQDSKFISTEIDEFLAYESKNYVRTISVYNETGTIICSSNKEIIGHKLAESEIFRWSKKPENKDKRFISSPIKLISLQKDSIPPLHFVIAAPIYKSIKKNGDNRTSEKFVGVVTETLEFDKLLISLISNYQSSMAKNHLWIMDSSGTLLFHSNNPNMAFASIKKQDKTCRNCHISFAQFDKMFGSKEGNIDFKNKNKQHIIAGFATLEIMNISWILVLNLPSEEVTHFVKKNLWQLYLLLGLLAITFFIISFFIYRSYKQRVRAEAENDQLREKSVLKEKVAESEKGYKNLVESSPDAIAVHCNGKIVYVNEAGAKLVGALKTEDLIGKPVLDFVHPDYHDSVTKRTIDVLQNNKPTTLSEEKFVRLDGSFIDVDAIAIPTTHNAKPAVQVIVRDISERKRIEEKLQESEERYKSFFNDSKAAMLLIDPVTAEIFDANAAACDFYGWSYKEITKMKISDLTLSPEKDVLKEMQKALDEKNNYSLFTHRLSNGEVRDVEIYSASTQVKGRTFLSSIIHDITQRRISEEALKENELKYRLLYDNNPHPMWVYDSDSLCFLTVNNAAIDKYGYSREELLSMTIKDIRPSEDLFLLLKNFSENKNELQRVTNARHILKNGLIIFAEVHSHSIKYENKNARLVLVYDITDRLKAEAELHKLSRAVEQGPASVVITNQEGDIEYVNQKFCEIIGYYKDEVIGKNPRIWKSGYHDKEFYENLWDTLLAGKNWNGEILNKKKNGQLLWESALISPIINNQGDIINFVAIMEDITEKKNMISELIEAKEMAESANKLKDAFIANISHEIRTPLNGLIGMSSLIRDTFQDKIKKADEELFEGIDFSSKRIIRTVDMILNYSRLQVEKFPVFRKNMELSSVCINMVREYAKAAKYKSLDLTFQNNCGSAYIMADEYSITLAISNLLDNAIKFTDKGFVQLILHKTQNEDIILDVKDSGIGISEDYFDKIFEPYLQEQMGYGRAYDGVGLGLSLVKKLLSLNETVISIESKKGKGSTFSINFGKEIKSIENKIKTVHKSSYMTELQDWVVLIVEDDEVNQRTIKRFIENKYDTIVTDSSDVALEILKKKNVDLILMDLSIYGSKNGLELTKELKTSKKYSHIPIIAITAHAFEEDKQNALAAGFDDFLAKPFTKQSLLDLIAGFHNKSKSVT
jgi:PAS domain S-box-containing protein